MVAAASGNVTGSGAEFAQAAVVNHVQQQGTGYLGRLVADGTLKEGSAGHAAMHAIVGCAGAAASAQGCGAGALGAAASSLLTNLFEDSPGQTNLSRESKRNLVTSLVAGIAAATTPGGGATAINAAAAAADNNWLAPKEIDTRKLAQTLCSASGGADTQACGTVSALNALDARREAGNKGTLYVGVTKGLTDLLLSPATAPVGLVNSLIENGAAETAVTIMAGVAGLPKKLYDGLGSTNPEVQGQALVEALALGFGVVAVGRVVVGAGGVKGTTNFATQSDQAYFWTGLGRGGDQVAAQLANARGGTTLEKIVKARGIVLPTWDAANPASVHAWQAASRAYAEGASGTVRAVIGDSIRPGSIWEKVELPALMANPNVARIIRVNPATGAETVIFSKGGL